MPVHVTSEGRVVVLDFGLVAELDDAEQHTLSTQMGTVVYMAPEQALPDAPITPTYPTTYTACAGDFCAATPFRCASPTLTTEQC